ncbi:MAG: helix-turn-helix domain-containing protein [Nitrososphaerota archaeon]|nr:helix-turn-helix domain-containing protein [Nitrososphaerota archaeon]MDG7037904.1 helix-turn-helix domain-containing protein [Nitrososphaerota archaeon]MDG7041315.1 helix-turn-helix domain-containing protein [Nitrososphaerota archaeon]MDG7042956.1 helix-turn-helix domain-containing protein [Nitrososphaerota archaeon]
MLIADLVLKHEKCWSELTGIYDKSSIFDLNMIMDLRERTSYTSVYIKVDKKNQFANFKNQMKESKYIGKIKEIISIRNVINNVTHFVNFVGIYNDTIGAILSEEGSPLYWFYFVNGLERWTFLVNNRDQLKQISERISNIATIKDTAVVALTKDSITYLNSLRARNFLLPYLTNKQWDTLARAFTMGYYNSPRNIRLSALSQRFNVSSPTLDERIRTSESKILRTLFNSDNGFMAYS